MSDRRVVVIVSSYHHGNTEKLARVLAGILGASVVAPGDLDPATVPDYDLIGFGSGIDSGRHYKALLDLADQMPPAEKKSAFIFSTCGLPASFARGEQFRRQVARNHAVLRKKLTEKGLMILDEFSCVGFNTNSFLKLFGGLNKGRPDATDLDRAVDFAVGLLKKINGLRGPEVSSPGRGPGLPSSTRSRPRS
jgi:flavodoxin